MAKMPANSPLQLLISSLRRNLRRGLTVTYPEVGGLEVKSLFNKNIIKPEDNREYIEEAIDAIAILHTKQGYNYKDNILAHLKASLG